MIADAVRCTHNGTGSTGTLTLASVSGYPQPTDVLGTSGTRLIDYEIWEYTDSTFATVSKVEEGIGSLVLSTNVLTRTPLKTWTSGGSIAIGSGASPASALNFGNTAANIQILMTAREVHLAPALPAMQSAQGDTWSLLNSRQQANSNSSTLTLVAGTKYYIPMEVRWGMPITSVAVEATSIATTGNVRVGIYDWGADGMPKNLITELTSASQIGVNTATGFKSISPSAPVFIPPGWYWVCVQADAAVVLRTLIHHGQSGGGSSGTRDCVYQSKTGTYGALPSAGDTGLTFVSFSANNQIAVLVK